MARARSVMRPSVVGVNKSGRPVVYHPPPYCFFHPASNVRRCSCRVTSCLQLNPTLGASVLDRTRTGKVGTGIVVTVPTIEWPSMAKRVVRGKQGGRQIRVDKRKEHQGDGPSRVVKRETREKAERLTYQKEQQETIDL